MKRVPPEIDRLMWAVAENPGPQAVLEFEVRYPEYRLEMLRRVEMVRGLRQEVKRTGFKTREIPAFEPRPVQPTVPPRGMAVAVGLAFAAVAFAGFAAYQTTRPTKPRPVATVDVTNPNTPPIVFNTPSTGVNPGPFPYPTSHAQVADPRSGQHPTNDPLSLAIPKTVVELDKPRDLKMVDADLVEALAAVTAGTNVKLKIGPGFVNHRVTLAFRDKTTREMLTQMAADYAFSVSDQGSNEYLLLPTPDTSANPDSDTPTAKTNLTDESR